MVDLKNVLIQNQALKLHLMSISLDLKGDFDYLRYPFVLSFSKEHNCPFNIYKLLSEFFQDRTIQHDLVSAPIRHAAGMGCPQGSPLSPLLWNILISGLLYIHFIHEEHIQAYADDVVIIISGGTRKQLEDIANRTLESVMEWVTSHWLVLNVEKCKCLLVSFQGKFHNRPPTIRLNSVSMPFVPELENFRGYF